MADVLHMLKERDKIVTYFRVLSSYNAIDAVKGNIVRKTN